MYVSRRFSRRGISLSGPGRVVVRGVGGGSGGMGMWGRFSMGFRERSFFVGIVVRIVGLFFGFVPESIFLVFKLRF
jgi:hypothetical protein